MPGDSSAAAGSLRNPNTQLCLDGGGELGLWQCHDTGGHQYWIFTTAGEIRSRLVMIKDNKLKY